MTRKLYITTSIPYVNAEPHVGYALELVQADVVARYSRLIGREVRFQTGTDENALKNVLAAKSAGIPTQEFVDHNAARFRQLNSALNISADDFIRTTEPRHRAGVSAFWKALKAADVSREDYTGLYCTGCEDFYLQRDLVDGKCPDHRAALTPIVESNYFFRLSQYQSEIEKTLVENQPCVLPETRRNEVLAFVQRGLLDFSISRSAARTHGWGTPVPGDEFQTVYVWVDALINYLSGIGFGRDETWRIWWNDDVEKIHVIGKNVWKFHAIYWPALLKSVGFALPDRLLVHGFVTVDGNKIGKSLGNAIDPFGIITRFGADALRYYLLRAIPAFGDGDFSLSRFEALYRTDLSNGIGNLVSRLAVLSNKSELSSDVPDLIPEPPADFQKAIGAFEYDRALESLWTIVTSLNQQIDEARPWELSPEAAAPHLKKWLSQLWTFVYWLKPFLPETSEKIVRVLFGGKIERAIPLFPRIG